MKKAAASFGWKMPTIQWISPTSFRLQADDPYHTHTEKEHHQRGSLYNNASLSQGMDDFVGQMAGASNESDMLGLVKLVQFIWLLTTK